ncbi:MAG: hypothetical protein GC181_06590 [Bacteroidetes bacterium]|nr:hypothetical protein [Bacteroidota bacterium]
MKFNHWVSVFSLVIISMIGCGNNSSDTTSTPAESDSLSGAETISGSHEYQSIATNAVYNLEESKTDKAHFLLKGVIENKPGAMVVLQRFESGELTFVDTVRTDSKGQYQLTGISDQAQFYFLTVN